MREMIKPVKRRISRYWAFRFSERSRQDARANRCDAFL
jgi:hypothetical protein